MLKSFIRLTIFNVIENNRDGKVSVLTKIINLLQKPMLMNQSSVCDIKMSFDMGALGK